MIIYIPVAVSVTLQNGVYRGRRGAKTDTNSKYAQRVGLPGLVHGSWILSTTLALSKGVLTRTDRYTHLRQSLLG